MPPAAPAADPYNVPLGIYEDYDSDGSDVVEHHSVPGLATDTVHRVPAPTRTAAAQDPPAPSPRTSDSSDPSSTLQPLRSPLATFIKCHSVWYARLVILLVAFLHCRHHVSFRACTLILKVVGLLFVALGALSTTDEFPRSMPIVIHRSALTDGFQVRPTCPQCHQLGLASTDPTQKCSACQTPLFKSLPPTTFEWMGGKKSSRRSPPVLATPIRPLSSLLEDFFSRDDMETKVDEWRNRPPPKQGELRDMPDGAFWNEVKAADDTLFFDKSRTNLEPGEIRLGVTMSLDWCVNLSLHCIYHDTDNF